MAKKVYIGTGPNCPRCGQQSELWRKSKNNTKSRVSAYCKNNDCVTKAFPPDSRKIHSYRVEIGEGPPCFRCLRPTITWAHGKGWEPPQNRGYYHFWHECKNDACITTLIMPPEAKVSPAKRHVTT